jgi:hypothetical protein
MQIHKHSLSSRRVLATCAIALSILSTFTIATRADVHFGKNVRIGGHDVSNQTFSKQRRGEYHIYNGKPPNPGCSWRNNGDGSKTKVCHLQRKPH